MVELNDIKCIIADGQNLLTFNSNNKWENVGVLENITSDIITTRGFAYGLLNTSMSEIYLKYTLVDTLSDGSEVYESEQITSSMGVTNLEDAVSEDGSTYKLKCTVPTFIPKDALASGYKIYAYSDDTSLIPKIASTTFSPESSHRSSVLLTIKTIYNYNSQVKFRYKVNSGEFTNWSDACNPYDDLTASIPASSLSIGTNSITVQVADFSDESKVDELVVADALTVTNNTPQLIIVTKDSDSFKVRFMISDDDASDLVSYRILMTNEKFTNLVVQDWTPFAEQPLDITYYIDSSKVVVDDTNVITIEYKDDCAQTTSKSSYNFIGKYKNIVFMDESGDYLTSDLGVLLKILDFKKVMAGTESEVKKVTLSNNNTYAITNLVLDINYINQVQGASIKLSKSNNPFIPLEVIDYGTEVIEAGGTKDIYVKLESSVTSEGLCTFNVVANADVVQ